jgi:hypothetical protein
VSSPGGFTYITAVPTVNADITGIRLMPNLVQNNALLRVVSRRAMAIKYVVVDGRGRQVMQFRQQVTNGTNDMQLSLQQLAAGTYWIIGTTDKGKLEPVRFIRL